MPEAVEEKENEQDAAENSDNQLDRKLIGGNHDPPEHIADQNEDSPEEGGIRQCPANLIALEHGDEVRHNQAYVGDGADYHDNGRGDHGDNSQSHEQHKVVGNAKVPGEILPHAHNVEVVRKQECEDDKRYNQPDDLIASPENQGKMPDQPGGQRLCHFILVGKVIGDAADYVAEHDADQRNHDHILEADSLDEPHKDPGSEYGEHKREYRPSPQCGIRQEQQGQKNAELSR